MLVRMMSSSGVMRGCRLLATLFLGALGISAWVSPAASAAAEPMPVVASFSVLGDMVAEIGGDHVKLTTIIGLGGDAHSFEPTPEHVRALSEARVLVVNGLGFEAWLPRLLAASNFQGQQVVASRGIEPRRLLASHAVDTGAAQAGQSHGHAGHDHAADAGAAQGGAAQAGAGQAGQGQAGHQHEGDIDPHAWQSLANGMIYARNIAEGLAKADPANAADYLARANRYIEEMKKLDAEVRLALGQIAKDKRKVVVPHDSLGYFGRDYGIEFIPIMGISSQAEASARNVAAIVDQVRAVGGAAIFLEGSANPKMAEQIARETGATVGGVLYADTLSEPDQPAGTYLGMFKWNAGQLIYALRPAR
ncbi:zinc/manganese transport system substrate-binding protein [Pusillimonas noertemannii]|uniref:Zinc/manganese transport system substrate-binding protein n=3 Tax=Pusillimonas noertemannii TaxID=305977 RepID=A0A2U1CPS2_9BURK|nr:zinc/manganese transport system substrate-binding protein [Pusillimonas noertemannii]